MTVTKQKKALWKELKSAALNCFRHNSLASSQSYAPIDDTLLSVLETDPTFLLELFVETQVFMPQTDGEVDSIKPTRRVVCRALILSVDVKVKGQIRNAVIALAFDDSMVTQVARRLDALVEQDAIFIDISLLRELRQHMPRWVTRHAEVSGEVDIYTSEPVIDAQADVHVIGGRALLRFKSEDALAKRR